MMDSRSEIVRIGALELRFLVDEERGSGDVIAFEFTVPPGARVPAAHFHEGVDEFVYGLEGALTTTIDGVAHVIRPGGAQWVRRGSVHHHENLGSGTARALIVLNPGSIGRRYFEETAAAVNGPGKPDPAAVKEIMRRHGLVPA